MQIKNKLKFAIHLIGPLLFVFLLWRIDLRHFLSVLGTIRWQYIIAAIVCQVFVLLFKSERWRAVISVFERLSAMHILKTTIYGSLYALITPARLGEGLKAPLIKSETMNYSKAFFTIFTDRFLDAGTIILTGYFGLVFLRASLGLSVTTLVLIAAALLFGGALFVGLVYFAQRPRQFEPKIKIIARLCHYVRLITEKLKEIVKMKNFKRVFWFTNFLNLVAFFFYFLTIYFITLSLELSVSFIFIVLCYSIIAFLAVMPISISGIGTRDMTLIYFLGFLNISAEKAIAVSLLDLVFMHYGVLLLFFIFFSVRQLVALRSSNKVEIIKT